MAGAIPGGGVHRVGAIPDGDASTRPVGNIADRPAASSQNYGWTYAATDTGILYESDGVTWIAIADLSGGGVANPLTTKGDLFGYSTTSARVPVGADGTWLKANSGAAVGVSYAAITESDVTNLTTDLAAKLAKASNLSDVASAPTSRYNLHEQILAGAQLVATTNLSLTGAATIDGVAATNGLIVLAAGQTAPAQNGPWTVNTGGAWTRPNDYPAGGTVIARVIQIAQGNTLAGTQWASNAVSAVTVDTTATTWSIQNKAYNDATYDPLGLAVAMAIALG